MVRMYHQLGSSDEQNYWLGLLLGHWRYVTCLAKMHMLIVASPAPLLCHSPDPQWISPIGFPAIPVCEIRVRAPIK